MAVGRTRRDRCRSTSRHTRVSPVAERITGDQRDYLVFRYRDAHVPVTVYSTAEPTVRGEPGPIAQEQFVSLVDDALDRFQPDVMLTYGGNDVGQATIAAARRRNIPVVFWLRNTAYRTRTVFAKVAGILVPSEFSRQHYKQLLEKIPLLIVEGRGGANEMQSLPFDLRRLEAHPMKNTSDPRQFYSVSRMVLMPSLCLETYGRVAAEAGMNGIPVLASSRGGLPENLAFGEAGFVFDLPERYTPESREIPTAEDVRPWVETIIRLWEDDAFHAEWSARARAHAETVTEEKLATRYHAFFAELLERHRGG